MTRPIGIPEPGAIFVGRDTRSRDLLSLGPTVLGRHMHIIGASGYGKSNYIECLIRQHLLQVDGSPRGISFIDPHGQTFHSLLEFIAEHRLHRYRRIRILDLTDVDFAFSFNPWLALASFERSVMVNLLTQATQQVWGQATVHQTPLITEVLEELYTALADLRLPISDAPDFLFADRAPIRGYHLERLRERNPDCWSFWNQIEFHTAPTRRDEYLAPVRRRLAPFQRSPNIRRVVSQTERSLDLAKEMDRGSVVLVNLQHGAQLSFEMSRLMGTLLINEYYTSCFRRKRVDLPHYLFVDECHQFLSPDIARILDQTRKFGLSLALAHQHLGHLREAGEHIFRSVMANTMTKVIFGGLDPDDAEYMARLVYRGSFDLQRPKKRLYRPTAVGSRLVTLAQESTSVTHGSTTGRSWSSGQSTAASTSKTKSGSVTLSKAATNSWATSDTTSESVASIDTTSEGESTSRSTTYLPDTATFFSPDISTASTEGTSSSSSRTTGTVTSSGSSNTHTEGGSISTGSAKTRGTSTSTGETHTTSSESGGSISESNSTGTTRGRSESYLTEYQDMPGPVWQLDEQIHTRSVTIAHLPVGQALVRVGNRHARRVVLPYVGNQTVRPGRVAATRREILLATPFVAPAAQVDAEYARHRQQLIEASTPREPDADLPRTSDAAPVREEPETIPITKLIEWK